MTDWLPSSGDIWFEENKECRIEPLLYEQEVEELAIYTPEGVVLVKPKQRLGFKLWDD